MLGIPAPVACRPPLRGRGFSLIELVIAISLIAILTLLGLPAFGTFLDNQKIRAAVETTFAGLQQARVEAVKRNMPVEFVMFDDAIDLNDFTFINSVTAKAGGANWAIRVPIAVNQYELVTTRSGAESSGSGSASIVVVTGGAPAVTFNGFGATNGMFGTTTFQFSRVNSANPDFACAPGGPIRCLNIAVTTGGQVKVCDPAVAPGTGDTRAC
jgi:type IV fimbrial biogenesis protein FimT